MSGHRLRDAAGPFHDEPDGLASSIEAHGLRLVEYWPHRGISVGVLPYLEEEAIARLRRATGPLGDGESEWRRLNEDFWRGEWVKVARTFAETSMQGPVDATPAYSAAEVLVRAAELRAAIASGQAEKAAALAMLVASWVFVGGVSIRMASAERADIRHRKNQQAKASNKRAAVHTDAGKVRKLDLVKEALKGSGPDAGTPDVWSHLFGVLGARGFVSIREEGAKDKRELHATDAADRPVVFKFASVQTMLGKLRASSGGKAKTGRPTKRPT